MVYTVTFNPAIDLVVSLKELSKGKINRCGSEEMFCGGKGVNVSVVLSRLGISSKALGFVAGFTGTAVELMVEAEGVKADFVRLKEGSTRINMKVKAVEETEINGQGPYIPQEAIKELFTKLDTLADGDTLVLAGSVPDSLPADIYEKILAHLSSKKIKFAVDAAKDLLLNSLKYKPFLIKPNNFELGEMFGVTLNGVEEIIEYAKRLKTMGAVNVLVSMAEKGAVLIDEHDRIHRCGVCRGEVLNSVGAGDSMVAGFIAGCEKGGYEYALKLGTAAGGATAFSKGLADREKIFEMLKQLG
ncbi:MAG: 1-phosphofructokinase [Firmicutes bacterium]|nr:1-phosphofructokinase [[Eubacterium] siraeum]MCM1487873.1 1-phosphofructokinase [Bacillota bacterium]